MSNLREFTELGHGSFSVLHVRTGAVLCYGATTEQVSMCDDIKMAELILYFSRYSHQALSAERLAAKYINTGVIRREIKGGF